MNQFFAKYEFWEDFQNGMYDQFKPDQEEGLILKAIDILTSEKLFLAACKSVILTWPISSKVNLTNTGCNRKAWLGHASCSLIHKVPEVCTRKAWGRMSEEQQVRANKIAQIVINSFELEYEKQNNTLCL